LLRNADLSQKHPPLAQGTSRFGIANNTMDKETSCPANSRTIGGNGQLRPMQGAPAKSLSVALPLITCLRKISRHFPRIDHEFAKEPLLTMGK